MEEIIKHINDTNASYRDINAGDAKNTDLFLDNEHFELFKDSGGQVTVRYSKENLSKAILFIASILPRKYDNSAIHKPVPYSSEFVYDQLEFLDNFFKEGGVTVNHKTQTWNARKDVQKKNGDIDNRFYFNGLLEDVKYVNSKGEQVSSKFTIRNYLAGGYSDLHIKKANDGIFDVWVTNVQKPYFDGKDDGLEDLGKSTSKDLPLQQITYGAPGTGKSHGIKEATKGHSVIRTTFHPDSDYSTFVGAYKPVMEEVDARVVPVVLNNGASFNQNNGTFKEKRISYKFVKQAFLKAYLGAWKKYAKGVGAKSNIPTAQNTSVASSLTVSTNSGFYTLTGISSDRIFFKRDFEIKKSNVQNVWNRIWSNGSFTIPTGTQPGMSLQFCICDWINKNITNCTSNDFEKGWTLFMERLQNSPFEHKLNRQTYEFSLSNVVDTVHVQTKNNASTRKTLQDRFANFTDNGDLSSVEDGICSLLNNEDHDFDAAWSKLQDKIQQSNAVLSSSGGVDNIEPQFLIIEEINRGNCAQIFGDLFQLLDRNDENGFSTYPIDADTDLQKEIEKAFKEDKDGDSENPYKLLNDIDVEGAVEDYTSNYGASLSEDIQEGRVLLLPPNLYIWATMNTSDQSLFPIDSAFKRRWAWDYVKITDGKKGWKIQGDGYSCDWWTFLQEVNERINKATSSDDKKLGYYFCKAKDGTIDEKLFVSKVIFYLWNDVFKDNDNTIFKVTESSDEPSFDDFYMENEDGEIVTNPSAVKQFLINVVEETNVTTDQSQTDEAEQSAQPVEQDSETQTTE